MILLIIQASCLNVENLLFGRRRRRREKDEIVVCKNACINPLNHFPAVWRMFLFFHLFVHFKPRTHSLTHSATLSETPWPSSSWLGNMFEHCWHYHMLAVEPIRVRERKNEKLLRNPRVRPPPPAWLCTWMRCTAAPLGERESERAGDGVWRLLRPAGNGDVFIRSSLILVRLSAQIAGREADIIWALGPSPAFYLPPSLPATPRSGARRSRCLRWRRHRCAWNYLEFIYFF